MKIRFLPVITIMALFLLPGCTNPGNGTKGPDETRQKVIVGYVNADAFYLISIQKRIKDVLDWLRSEKSIFFQPSPDELLRLSNVSLKREIRKIGMKQPGMKIDPKEKFEVAGEIAREKSNKIAARLRESATMDQVAEEFNLRLPNASQKIPKGENPEYDKVIWDAPIGGIAGPVEREDRIFIFRVDQRGKDPKGTEWAMVFPIAIIFPDDEAQMKLEEKRSETWTIRIVNGFFSSLGKYYKNNFDGAQEELSAYLGSGEGRKDSLAHYLMMKIYIKQYQETGNADYQEKSIKEIQKAIETSTDPKLKPYLQVELGTNYQSTSESEKAKTEFRAAFDNLHNDKYLAIQLLDLFKSIGDTEYVSKATQKIASIEELIREEASSKPRKPKVKNVIMTGEGPLQEDPEAIWNEERNKSDCSGSESGNSNSK